MHRKRADSLPIGEPVVEVEDTIDIAIGSAEFFDGDATHPAAVLWMPDPEVRRGWREYYVKKQQAKPGQLLGFHKQRS